MTPVGYRGDAEDTFVVEALHPELMERFDSPMGALERRGYCCGDNGEKPWLNMPNESQ